MKILLFSLCFSFCSSPAIAQALEFRDVPDRSGVRLGYNRFEDASILATKRDVVTGSTGKGSLLDPGKNSRYMEIQVSAAWKGPRPAEPIGEIALAIFSQPQTKAGSLMSGIEGRGRFYISSDAKVVALADGQRVELGSVAKADRLSVFGDYSGAAGVLIPIETFRNMIGAEKLELAVGVIEIKLIKRNIERMRGFLAEIDARQPRR